MKIILDVRKSAMENAQALFAEAKKFKKKAEGAKKAIEHTKRKLEGNASTAPATKTSAKSGGKARGKKKWFDEYRQFITTNGFRCVGGKNAKQNDLLVASQLKEGDLFFHADVHGASAVILKDGLKAKEKDLGEAAQFAACYSNAWKGGGTADVYCVGKEQVSKYSSGEYVGKGAFLIAGERRWFKNVELRICVESTPEGLRALPALACLNPKNAVFLTPGSRAKEELYSALKQKLGLKKTDEFFALLPGNSELA